MAELEKNDIWQDRGLIKVTDGTYTVELTDKGELKVKETGSSEKVGGKSIINSQDEGSNYLLNNIYKELKKINLHLSLMTDVHLDNTEV